MRDPSLTASMATIGFAGWLMVRAGFGKRMLEPREPWLRLTWLERIRRRCRFKRR